MSNVLIYHNPSCSKSREALALLQTQGLQPTVIHYLDTSFTEESLLLLLHMLNIAPRQLIRTKETLYQTLQLEDSTFTDAELIQAMIMHPRLIERPIVVYQGKAIIARPAELILRFLNN